MLSGGKSALELSPIARNWLSDSSMDVLLPGRRETCQGDEIVLPMKPVV